MSKSLRLDEQLHLHRHFHDHRVKIRPFNEILKFSRFGSLETIFESTADVTDAYRIKWFPNLFDMLYLNTCGTGICETVH